LAAPSGDGGAIPDRSGGARLVKKADGSLASTSTPYQDNLRITGVGDTTGTPILGLGVWEHACYLHCQRRRPDHVTERWRLVIWIDASKRFGQERDFPGHTRQAPRGAEEVGRSHIRKALMDGRQTPTEGPVR